MTATHKVTVPNKKVGGFQTNGNRATLESCAAKFVNQ